MTTELSSAENVHFRL